MNNKKSCYQREKKFHGIHIAFVKVTRVEMAIFKGFLLLFCCCFLFVCFFGVFLCVLLLVTRFDHADWVQMQAALFFVWATSPRFVQLLSKMLPLFSSLYLTVFIGGAYQFLKVQQCI